MSSIERAPEPTMEEILASIRRIISDDDSNSTRAAAAPTSVHEEARLDVGDVEADTRIIDDIARVLSGGSPATAVEDDILDLTREFGPAESGMEEAPIEAVTDFDAMIAVSQPGSDAIVPSAETTYAYQSPTFTTGAYAFSAGAEAERESGIAEPASALEEAIARLRAGMGSTFEPEPEAEDEAEDELVLTDLEVQAISQEPVAEASQPAEEQPFWPPSPSTWAKNGEAPSEPAPPRVNGGSRHEPYYAALEISGQMLQESVKATLRPLLRQWLDSHMTRVLEAALRDELKGADENMSRMLTAALHDELRDVEARRQSN
jgi:cell pole-organizing protein PopZ